VTFQLTGGLQQHRNLQVWYSQLSDKTDTSTLFVKRNPITPDGQGRFTLQLGIDEIYTISTITTARKGSYPAPPAQKPFSSLLPYSDNFDSYPLDSEAHYFMDQTGSWSIYQSNDPNHKRVMRQEVILSPINWCGESTSPISLIGSSSFSDINITSDIYIESSGHVVLGVRVPYGGCGNNYANGYYYSLYDSGQWSLTRGASTLKSGTVSGMSGNKWVTISFQSKSISGGGVELVGTFQGAVLFDASDSKAAWGSGWAALGSGWNYSQFDNFRLSSPSGQEESYVQAQQVIV